MKLFTSALTLALLCAPALADTSIDRQSFCANYGNMLQSIAAWRDKGSTQENTLKYISGIKGISKQEKTVAVAAIYTDKAFQGSRGPDFGLKMRQTCLRERN